MNSARHTLLSGMDLFKYNSSVLQARLSSQYNSPYILQQALTAFSTFLIQVMALLEQQRESLSEETSVLLTITTFRRAGGKSGGGDPASASASQSQPILDFLYLLQLKKKHLFIFSYKLETQQLFWISVLLQVKGTIFVHSMQFIRDMELNETALAIKKTDIQACSISFISEIQQWADLTIFCI